MIDVAIVTDSSAGIPREMAEKVNLNIIPMGIQIDNHIYREGLDITTEEFYAKFEDANSVSTSQPSPNDFLEVYQKLAKKAKEIISIHVTSLGSGTVSVANLIKEQISIPTFIVDSKTASMAQGFIALVAAKAAQKGKTREEILEIIEQAKEQTAVFVAVPTLKYLARSGRISAAKSMLANILSIKPILGVNNGIVDVIDKVRSYPKALQRLVNLVEERFPSQELKIAILHTNAPEKAAEFKANVEERLHDAKVFIMEMGTALAVHGGQGMIGIAAYCGSELD